MSKKITYLVISLIMIFSLAACGDRQSRLDELQKKIDTQDNRLTELEDENKIKDDKIADLEQELHKIKEESVKDDFVLTVSVDSTVAGWQDTINVNAVLHNQSGKGHYIGYASPQKGWRIDGWREDEALDLSGTFHQIYFGKDTSLPFSYNIDVDNQKTGLYELEIEFKFVLSVFDEGTWPWDTQGVSMTIRSEKISILIIQDL